VPFVDEALRLELSKYVGENNALHNVVVMLKEQLAVQQH